MLSLGINIKVGLEYFLCGAHSIIALFALFEKDGHNNFRVIIRRKTGISVSGILSSG